MRLWLRVRNAPAIGVTIAAVVAVTLVFGGIVVPLPSIGGVTGLRVPIGLLAPLAVAIAVGWGLAIGAGPVERASVRRLDPLDTALALTCAGGAAAVLAFLQGAGVLGLGYAAARDVLGYVGLLMLGRWLLGDRAASLLPVAWILLVAAFGADGSGEPRWWAWPLRSWQDAASWALALGLLWSGTVVSTLGWRVQPRAG